MKSNQDNKALVRAFYNDLEAANAGNVADVLKRYTSSDYQFYGVHPFDARHDAEVVAELLWQPLLRNWTSLQRREDIFMAGASEIDGDEWVTSMGHFMGLRDGPWLGIPPTRKLGFLRYADFNCVRGGKICRTGFFCDILAVMSQAGCNPLPPQSGVSVICPGPRSHDGLLFGPQEEPETVKTLDILNRMIDDLDELNKSGNDHCPAELLSQTWAEDMVWYGPEGIGATYTIPRYQEQHQFPFRMGLENKVFNGHICRFAEGNYACFFGWPNLTHTPRGGFLGLTGSGCRVDMRVVDVYRRKGDRLAENWVLIDIPWWLKQQGLDIFARMAQLRA